MHRRKTRQFICTVTQYYGLVISRYLGVILDGPMKTSAQWQSSKWVQKSKSREGSRKQIKKMLLCYSLNPWCTHLLNHPLLLPHEGYFRTGTVTCWPKREMKGMEQFPYKKRSKSWVWRKMLGVNAIIYIIMSSVEKVSRKLSFTITEETGGAQIIRHKEDKRKSFFTQSTTGCCQCQKIRWVQKQMHFWKKEITKEEEINISPLAHLIPEPWSAGRIKNIPKTHHYVFALFLYASINNCFGHCQRQDTGLSGLSGLTQPRYSSSLMFFWCIYFLLHWLNLQSAGPITLL